MTGRYILLEKSNSRAGEYITNFDCMGYTTDERAAMAWVDDNREFRYYKYCPEVEFEALSVKGDK